MTDVNGKVAWITGASSGIGRELARVMSENGASIILSGRRVKALEEVAACLKTDTLILPFEVADFDILESKVSIAWHWKGRVDILVNNAGIGQRSLAIETVPQVYRDIIDIDLTAPILLTQLQLKKMASAGGAHIVSISSVAGRIGTPMRTAYCAAKHGLIGYMEALRSEVCKPHNIQVTNILPGSTTTDVARNALTGDGSKRGDSDINIEGGIAVRDCAEAILEAVQNNVPERMIARGLELEFAKLRHADPDQFFAQSVEIGAKTVEHGLLSTQ